MKQDIGVIGLGVMGKSISRNLAQKGFKLSMYNRHVLGTEEKVAERFKATHLELNNAEAFDDLNLFVNSLETPRKIILMVNAGNAVDLVLEELMQHLEKGDIVLDGGNSHYLDTEQRITTLSKRGFHFLGAGISGGERGALTGPSIMPSGNITAFNEIKPFLEAIAAKDEEGKACCSFVGKEGSGHFVKMIHNGLEYVEMQLIAEYYAFLKQHDYTNDQISALFESWRDEVGSYLLEISAKILKLKEDGVHLLDHILDKAANKGTGKWSTEVIANSGEAASLIPSALLARYLSYFKEKREEAAHLYSISPKKVKFNLKELKEAYQFSRILNHHQGFALIAQASQKENWGIKLGEIARIWSQGCIIKSDLMREVKSYLDTHNQLLMHPKVHETIKCIYPSAQKIASTFLEAQIHAPCLLESVNFFHGYKTASSSANLIQAQRDFFGAHTYQKINDPSDKTYHTDWEQKYLK